jgi:hypothetical protein
MVDGNPCYFDRSDGCPFLLDLQNVRWNSSSGLGSFQSVNRKLVLQVPPWLLPWYFGSLGPLHKLFKSSSGCGKAESALRVPSRVTELLTLE